MNLSGSHVIHAILYLYWCNLIIISGQHNTTLNETGQLKTYIHYNNTVIHDLFISNKLRKNQLILNRKIGRIYVLFNETKHRVPGYDTIIANDYDMRTLFIFSNEDCENIPSGESIPKFVKDYNESFDNCPCHAKSRIYDNKAIQSIPSHHICFYNNSITDGFFHKYLSFHHHLSDMKYSLVDQYALSNHPSCDIFIELYPESSKYNNSYHKNDHKYICPESCLPKPYSALRLDWLTNFDNVHSEIALTCSMTVNMTRHILEHKSFHDISKEHTIAILLKHIVKRRVQECFEKEYWPKFHTPMREDEHGGKQMHNSVIMRRKVFGLVIWIGSTTRLDMSRKQIEVLESQYNSDPELYVSGWIGTDEQYSCRLGSTLPDWSKYPKIFETLIPPNIYDKAPHVSELYILNGFFYCSSRIFVMIGKSH